MTYKETKTLFTNHLNKTLFKFFNINHFEIDWFAYSEGKDIDYFDKLRVFYRNQEGLGSNLILELYATDESIINDIIDKEFSVDWAEGFMNIYPEMRASLLSNIE